MVRACVTSLTLTDVTLSFRKCLGLVLEGGTPLEAKQGVGQCVNLTTGIIGTVDFNLSDHHDILLYCYAVRVDLVTNGTLDLDFNRFNQAVNCSVALEEAERSMLKNLTCTDFMDCFLQPCNVTVNQLGRLVPSLRERGSSGAMSILP